MPDRLDRNRGHEQFRNQLTEAGRIGGGTDPLVVELRLLNLMYLAVHQVLSGEAGPLGPVKGQARLDEGSVRHGEEG